MADETKKTPPAPAKPTSTPAGKAAPAPRAPVTHYTPDPDVTSTSEWAEEGGPPVTPAPTFGYGSKRIDIWPRLPIDPTDFLDIQQSQTGDMLAGLPGMIADKGYNDKISRVPETDVPFGHAVAIGETGDGYCKVAAAGGDRVLGIAMRDMTCAGSAINVFPGQSTFEGYPKDHWSVTVIKVGRVWALPTTAVKEGDPVGFGAGGALQTGGTAIPGAKWSTSAPAGMLAVVELNLP